MYLFPPHGYIYNFYTSLMFSCFFFSDFVCVLEMNIFQLVLRLCNKTGMSDEESKVGQRKESDIS